MIKKLFFAAAIALIANPSFVSAQSFFFSFEDTSLVTTQNATAADVGTSASAFLFADGLLELNSFNLAFTSSDTSVLEITGGQVFNPLNIIDQRRFDIQDPLNPEPPFTVVDAGNANIFPVSISGTGLNPNLTSFDDLFDPGVGPNGGTLIARLDYDIVGLGVADLDIGVGDAQLPFVNLPSLEFGPISFGSVSLSVVPEPSSAMVLIMSAVGLAARRRRS